MRDYDRHVEQGGLSGARVSGRYAAFSKVAPVEGVVIAVRPTDDLYNKSKRYMEYDVRDLRTGQVYRNCRRLAAMAGMEDGDENVLRAASRSTDTGPASSLLFDPYTASLSTSDGDMVLLLFVYGAHHSPVIVGVLQQSKTDYGGTRLTGYRRFTTHRGTEVEMSPDGTYTIRRAQQGSRIQMSPEGDITLDHGSGPGRVTVEPGVVTLDGFASSGVMLGRDAVESAVLGDTTNSVTIAPVAAAANTAAATLEAILVILAPELAAASPPLSLPPSAETTLALGALLNAIVAYLNVVVTAFGNFPVALSAKVKVE